MFRYQRRLLRDVQERGDTGASVSKAWDKNALHMNQRLLEPQWEVANLVLFGEADVRDSVGWVVAFLHS